MKVLIDINGKQFKIALNSIIEIEKIKNKVGSTCIIGNVLAVFNNNNTEIGMPYVINCKVTFLICDLIKKSKIRIIKFKRRKHYMRHIGHRQHVSRIKVISINYNLGRVYG